MPPLFQFNIWTFAVPGAIVAGYWLMLRRSRQLDLPTPEMENALQWAIGLGLVVSHAVEILLYKPAVLEREGWVTLLKFWQGLSSFGGFAGAVGTLLVFYAIRRKPWWREADVYIQALVTGWVFGRLGCTVSGDHPGPRTNFFLAYPYPDGPRHNLGLYEFLFTLLVLVPGNLLLHRKRPPTGSFLAYNCLLYGAARFALDFMRATDVADADPRYFGFTLAQALSLVVFLFGAWCLVMAARRRWDPISAPGP
jgi:phosphatidylglycerol:prolipoprotein diacylglycerol transferase